MAEKLPDYQYDRTPLIQGLHEIAFQNGRSYLQDKGADDSKGPVNDVCPFTAMSAYTSLSRPPWLLGSMRCCRYTL